MISEQDLYAQALAAFHAQDLVKARDLFSQLLKINPKKVEYWLWMSAAVPTPKERVYCLRQVLQLDPENEEAALGLRMLGEIAPDTKPAPLSPVRIPWKTQLELADSDPSARRALRSRIIGYSLLALVVLAGFAYGIILALRPALHPADTSPIKKWTLTPSPTYTQTLPPTNTPVGPTQISIALEATFTATPIYVATPHNRLEAYEAGMRAYAKGDWAKAADYFNQVLAVEPNDADVYYHLGDVYRFQGNYSAAQNAYHMAIQIDGNFAPGYLGQAQVDLYGPDPDLNQAISSLERAVQLDPNFTQASLELANAYLANNDPNAALPVLNSLQQALPNNAQVELGLAKVNLEKGSLDDALENIEDARRDNRSLVEIYSVWAQILQAQGKYQESLVPLQAYVDNSPTSASAQLMLARAYAMSGDNSQALSIANSILSSDARNIDAYLLRADLELAAGNNEPARADFNAVLRIDYGNFAANLGIGRVLLAEKFAGGAYNDFDYTAKLAKTDSQKAILTYWYAMAHLGLDQIEPAIKDFQDALAYPGNLLPSDLRLDAEKQLNFLYTSTPTATVTLTPKPSLTPVPSKTPTATPKPRNTATPTPTPTQK